MKNPETFEEAIQQVSKEIFDTLVKKQYDYGHRNILTFGEKGVVVRANDKMARLVNLIWERESEPENESLEDNWMDLAGYAFIALMLRRGIFTLPLSKD